ncbi:MAG: carboxypeptidase-like regulatory domain-containing protein, partial [Candidatus Micrarchaeota archaeon]|nr:carboxypeptidase-like regulatory domain-containing protein [Candidatus Micrarchaeota archaeon]
MVPGLLKPLLKGYFLLEEGYYDALDAVEEKLSIPVYDWFVNPLESHRIPSFPVFLLLVFILFAGALVVLTSQSAGPAGLQVLVYGKTSSISGQPLDNAVVTLALSGKEVAVLQTRRGLAEFPDAPSGSLGVSVSKAGFSSATATVDTAQTNVLRLELVCANADSCAELEAAAGFRRPTQPGNQNPHFGPGTLSFESDPDGFDASSTTGRLLVLVRDENGALLDAQATVIDVDSQGTLERVFVSQGAGILSGLPIGKRLYVNVLSKGYLPFYGGDQPFVIQPATNKITVILEKAAPGELKDTGFSVVDESGAPVAGATVDLFLSGHAAVLHSDFADENGALSLEL